MARPRRYPAADIYSISKICSKCGEERLLTKYNKDKTTIDGLASTCYICCAAINRERYKNDPEYRKNKKIQDDKRRRNNILSRTIHRCKVCRIEKELIDFDEEHLLPESKNRKCKICLYGQPKNKFCGSCKQTKPIEEYFRKKNTTSGYGPHCKQCQTSKTKIWRKDNDAAKLSVRKWHLKKKYNLSWEAFEVLYNSQGCKCAICRKDLEIISKGTAVDHCHHTGLVRGILCVRCNTGIGQFGDREDLISAALKYLQDRRTR